MSSHSVLLKRREALLHSLSEYPLALAGNLGKSKVPPRTGKYYWRLTWKEKQRTKVQYVRQEKVTEIYEGVRQFAKLRKTVLHLGEVNRAIALLERENKESALESATNS